MATLVSSKLKAKRDVWATHANGEAHLSISTCGPEGNTLTIHLPDADRGRKYALLLDLEEARAVARAVLLGDGFKVVREELAGDDR